MPENTLRKTAFVAMPFREKETHIASKDAPEKVDFDKLWAYAIQPALEQLGYHAIRADAQINSVILRDMHKYLVHADLVVGDISISNANVYYEIGVRHAAREDGCVLIAADWARPDFDLGQIRQARYPMPGTQMQDKHYKAIHKSLVESLPALISGTGPVYSLTEISDESESIRTLVDTMERPASDFRRQMREAELKAMHKDKEPLRALMQDIMTNDTLPDYVYKDFLLLVRDQLAWSDVVTYVEALPESIQQSAFIQEQKALANGNNMEDMFGAIAALEDLIAENGATPELCGLLGGRYKRLVKTADSEKLVNQNLEKAIKFYEQGMALDLNQFYCSCNLPLLYLQRGMKGDNERASDVSSVVVMACERTRELDNGDAWLPPTLLSNAFYQQNLVYATELVEEIERSDIVSWMLGSAINDVRSSLQYIDKPEEIEPFTKLADRLASLISEDDAK